MSEHGRVCPKRISNICDSVSSTFWTSQQLGRVVINKKAQLSLTNPRDAVETWVMGHSRASKVTPFDSLHVVSYYRPIVIWCLKCTVFEILRQIGQKSPKTYSTFIWHVHWGDPLRIFRRVIPFQKVKSWGSQKVYISRSCFRCARHNTGCDRRTDGRTDRHVAVAKTALCIVSRG